MNNTNITFSPIFTITNSIAAALTRIERARGFLDAATLSEYWLRSMSRHAFLLEAHHTTHIEGTHLTLAQSVRLLEGQSIAETDADDVRELLNYREAFTLVSDYLNNGGPITETLIREIHKRLVSGVRGGSAKPGEYRQVQNYVANGATGEVIYTPPPPFEVPEKMRELIAWLNKEKEIHPVLVSAIAQFHFVHIHPFVDGNGRTSRLLSTLVLYRSGYNFKRLFTISEYYDRNRPLFYKAIQSVRDNGMDMTGWLEYFSEGLATQLVEIQERGRQAISHDILVKQNALSERQSKALSLALEKSSFTIQDFEAACPDINRRTLQRDLKNLLDKRLLVSEGATNQLAYHLPPSNKTCDKLAT
ncbi:cell division protein Fic [Planctomycetales bacterium]|nr:cell division protein Fic [Planctomycetales bacterium]